MDYTKFLHGPALVMSQINAMVSKKVLYSIRNWILLLIQILIPTLFIIITMLLDSINTGNKDLPELAISFDSYLETVTTLETKTLAPGSISAGILADYQNFFTTLPGEHRLTETTKNFEEAILDQYGQSLSKTNLNYMVGATFEEANITAWFNNQGSFCDC